jgi:plasmid stabilization system protein ParE
MARVVIAERAHANLRRMIRTHSLPGNTRERVRNAIAPLAEFPQLGPELRGRWRQFRFVLGPWPWMLILYLWDEATDTVVVVTIQDARSSLAATSDQ